MKKLTKINRLLRSSEEVKNEVLRTIVPLAISTYEALLLSNDEKIKLDTANAIMDIAGTRGKGGSSNAPAVSFHFPTDTLKAAIIGLEQVTDAAKKPLLEEK